MAEDKGLEKAVERPPLERRFAGEHEAPEPRRVGGRVLRAPRRGEQLGAEERCGQDAAVLGLEHCGERVEFGDDQSRPRPLGLADGVALVEHDDARVGELQRPLGGALHGLFEVAGVGDPDERAQLEERLDVGVEDGLGDGYGVGDAGELD